MDNEQSLALFVIVLAGFGLYLQSQGKLIPAIEVVTGPNAPNAPTNTQLGHFVIAFLVFLFIISFMSSKNAIYTTLVIALGALLVNNKKMGQQDLIHTLFGTNTK